MIIIDPDNDLTLDDINTLDDADKALDLLDQAVCSIEIQLADTERVEADKTWAFTARHALAAKKVARQAVQRKRGMIRRQHQEQRYEIFIKTVKELDAVVFSKAMAAVHVAGV